jgi:hypothetical protein
MREMDFLSLVFLSCNTGPPIMWPPCGSVHRALKGVGRIRGTNTNMKLMLVAVLTAIKPSVSDPRI